MTDRRKLLSHPVPTVDDRSLYDLAIGLFGSQAFLVALDLGLFRHLGQAAGDAKDIAAHFGLAPRSAEALLLVCVSLGLLRRDGEAFALTDLSRA